MKKEQKTNAARLLDKAGIKYSLNGYEVDENDLSAVHVAQQMGVEAGLLFKTLILRGAGTVGDIRQRRHPRAADQDRPGRPCPGYGCAGCGSN